MKFLEDQETNIYNKTKIYTIKRKEDILPEDFSKIPKYKIILSKMFAKYEMKCFDNNIKPLSLNSMKTKYGLPNNLNNYFITNPNHEFATKPTTIQIKNAYILILVLEMDIETANYFLESLHLPRLDSPAASDLSHAIYYCMRCNYSIEKANEFIISNKLEALY